MSPRTTVDYLTMNFLYIPEATHPLIHPLLQVNDSTLMTLLQNNPHKGKYLVAIFCRYHHKIRLLISKITEQTSVNLSENNITAIACFVWKEIAHFLVNFDRENLSTIEKESLYVWLTSFVEDLLNHKQFSETYLDKHNLQFNLFPLYFYTEIALNLLTPKERLIVVTQDKFAWGKDQIINYLEAKGEMITEDQVQSIYDQAHRKILEFIPSDIDLIYLDNLKQLTQG